MKSCKQLYDEWKKQNSSTQLKLISNIKFIEKIYSNDKLKFAVNKADYDIDKLNNIGQLLLTKIENNTTNNCSIDDLKEYDSIFTKQKITINDNLNSYLTAFNTIANQIDERVKGIVRTLTDFLEKLKKLKEQNIPIPEKYKDLIPRAQDISLGFINQTTPVITERYSNDSDPNIKQIVTSMSTLTKYHIEKPKIIIQSSQNGKKANSSRIQVDTKAKAQEARKAKEEAKEEAQAAKQAQAAKKAKEEAQAARKAKEEAQAAKKAKEEAQAARKAKEEAQVAKKQAEEKAKANAAQAARIAKEKANANAQVARIAKEKANANAQVAKKAQVARKATEEAKAAKQAQKKALLPEIKEEPFMCKKNIDSETHNTITHIYHYYKNKKPNLKFNETAKITYRETNDINELIKIIQDKNLCENNILIYGKSFIDKNIKNEEDVSIDFNNFLSQLSNTNQYKNISLIQETNDTRKLVYKVYYKASKQLLLNKIVNVFPNKDIYSNKNIKEFDSTITFNRTYETTLRDFDDKSRFISYGDQSASIHGSNGKKGGTVILSNDISFRIRQINQDLASDTNKLEDQWWFKWYFGVPPCATGRLIQLSGTCWFNSTLNSLILTPKIALIFKKRFEEWFETLSISEKEKIEKTTLDGCPRANLPLEHLLYITINNIIIKGIKAIRPDGNFMAELASLTKSIGKTNSEEEYKQIKTKSDFEKASKYGDSYNGATAAKIILTKLFKDNYSYYSIIDCNGVNLKYKKKLEEYDDYFNNIYKPIKKIFNDYVSEHNRILKIFNDYVPEYNKILTEYRNGPELDDAKRKLSEYQSNLDDAKRKLSKFKSNLNDADKKLSEFDSKVDIFKTETKVNKYHNYFNGTDEKITNITSKDINEYMLSEHQWNDNDKPVILLVISTDYFKQGRHEISINGYKYLLESASINIDKEHAVAGLHCGTTNYIYDSNNFLAKSNWQDGDIKEYIDLLKSEGAGYGKSYNSYIGLEYLVYVRADSKAGGMSKNFHNWKGTTINSLKTLKCN